MALRTVLDVLPVMLPPRLQTGLPFTCEAAAPAFSANAGVLGGERVAFYAVGLGGCQCCEAFPTKSIGALSDGFQMSWTHTATHATQMIKHQTAWNRPFGVDVSPAMSRHCPRHRARRKHAVSAVIDRARPDPAVARLIDFGPETRCRWAGNVLGVLHGDIAVAAKTNVVGVAHSALVGGRGAVSNRTATIARHLGLILQGVMRATVTAVRPLPIVPRREVSPWHAA